MYSYLESFSTEFFFEIFEYLSPFDLFRAFIGLNRRLNAIISLYPLRLDFRSISQSKFDVICNRIQAEQVISLAFSNDQIPDQIKLFLQKFSRVEDRFTRLSAVSFEGSWARIDEYALLSRILMKQSKHLTQLNVPLTRCFESAFPYLTHLTIGYCTVTQVNQVLSQLQCSLIHLDIFVGRGKHEEHNMLPNLDQWSNCLTHLTIRFKESTKAYSLTNKHFLYFSLCTSRHEHVI
jgi:hypothetical protein